VRYEKREMEIGGKPKKVKEAKMRRGGGRENNTSWGKINGHRITKLL